MPLNEKERRENREANKFARQLLMPDQMVRDWMEKHGKDRRSVKRIASAFEVSEGLAAGRLTELGYDIGDGT